MVLKMSQADGQQKEQIQDLGSYTGCFMPFLIPVLNFEDHTLHS